MRRLPTNELLCGAAAAAQEEGRLNKNMKITLIMTHREREDDDYDKDL